MQFSLVILVALLSVSTGWCQGLSNQLDSVSYSAGIIVGKNLKLQKLSELNYDLFLAAVNAVMTEEDPAMSPSDAERYLRNYQLKKEQMIGEANRTAGAAFLAENAKKEGVTVTASGLQYEVIKLGDGDKPLATDTVFTHYHGTLIDGTVFDSSVERGEPIEFPLNRVISGWTEALQLMPAGSIYRIYLPYNLAYGERGAGPVIGPYSALIFDIELLEIR